MIDAPNTTLTYVPIGQPRGFERLGIGQVSARPESARALNAPEEANAKAPFSERQAAIESSLTRARSQNLAPDLRGFQQFVFGRRGYAELGARARVAAGGDARRFSAGSGGDADAAAASSSMRQRVELAVRLALPSEEPRRQFSILV